MVMTTIGYAELVYELLRVLYLFSKMKHYNKKLYILRLLNGFSLNSFIVLKSIIVFFWQNVLLLYFVKLHLIPHVFVIPKELHLLIPVRWYSVRNLCEVNIYNLLAK